MFTNVCAQDVDECAQFFVSLLKMKVHFASDWFVILTPDDGSPYELGIIRRDHKLVPDRDRGAQQGVYLTFVVEDVDVVYSQALELKLEVVQPPTDEFYGQRRLLVRAPEGLLVDISAPVAPSPSN